LIGQYGTKPILDHQQKETGQTCLLEAFSVKNTTVVEALLDRGADVNLASNSGWTALLDAVE